MLDLLQHMMFGRRVTAHNKSWVVVQVLAGDSDKDVYLAIEESAVLPTPAQVIIVPRVTAPPSATTPG